MFDNDSDRVERLLDELGPAEPPAGFTAGVMARLTKTHASAHGRVVPTASNLIAFRASDTGRILGVGNGDPSSHEPDHASERRAFNGLCMAIVQARKQPAGDGVRPPVVIEASSPGLTSAALTLKIGRTGGRPALE